MNRELDGCYFRIMRDGVGQSVCFTDLTKEERDTWKTTIRISCLPKMLNCMS